MEYVIPRIKFHCNNNKHRIRNLDFDDLFQELSIKLWTIYDKKKIPEDMQLDRRFTNYLNMVFYNEISQLWLRTIERKEYKQNGKIVFRDTLDAAQPMEDFISEIK